MKKLTTPSHLPLLVLAAGLTGAFARAMMYLLLQEETGLLAAENPMLVLCWVLTAAVTLCLWLVLRGQQSNNRYSDNFPQNPRVLPAAILAALGILSTILTDWNLRSGLAAARFVLGVLSAPALITIGIVRRAGRRPNVCFYGVLCLFYAVNMVCSYQLWSGNPQTADYCFSLLACACLTISAYQRTAFCAKLGNRRAHLFFCLMAGFFSMLCIPGAEHPWLYLTGGCFFLTDLAMTLPRSRETDAA